MIEIRLYKNNDDNRKIGKTLTQEESFECVLKDDVSILQPTVKIATTENIFEKNYAFIPDFNRYYFITDTRIIRNNFFELTLRCDVLESHKENILISTAIISRQENIGQDFLIDDMQPVYGYKNTEIEKFPYPIGNKNNLQYILTVGGNN